MNEEYLDTVKIDGLDETYAANMDVDDVVSPNIMLVDFVIDGSGSMGNYEMVMQECFLLLQLKLVDMLHRKISILIIQQEDVQNYMMLSLIEDSVCWIIWNS